MPSYYKSRFSSRASNLGYRDSESSSSGFWILIIVFIVLIIISVMTGSIYKKYEKFTNSFEPKKYTLQYYCMEQCGHCKQFESTVWTAYSDKVNSTPLSYRFDTVKYDIMKEGIGKEMGDKYNITSTPTILLYDKEKDKVYSFMDERTEEKLTAFANKMIAES